METGGVVLDIDGVLVDVANSYRRAIVETVERCYDASYDRAVVQSFKTAGGFNNDWELTDALALYSLSEDQGYDASIEAYTDAIAAAGGGLEGAKTVLEGALSNNEWTTVADSWDPEAIRSVFQQLYLGSERYREIEGQEPTLKSSGFIESEPILITEETSEWLESNFSLGVFTGRPLVEARIALGRTGLSIPEDNLITMDSIHPGKPAPSGLIKLGKALDSSTVTFVGDTVDDMALAVAANQGDHRRRYRAIGVQSGGLEGQEGKQILQDAGARTVIETVNDLPSVIEPVTE